MNRVWFRASSAPVRPVIALLLLGVGLSCAASKHPGKSAASVPAVAAVASSSSSANVDLAPSPLRVSIPLGHCRGRLEESLGGDMRLSDRDTRAMEGQITDALRRCLARPQVQPGTASVRVDVKPDGSTLSVDVAPGGAMPTERGQCLRAALRGLHWPARAGKLPRTFMSLVVVSCDAAH